MRNLKAVFAVIVLAAVMWGLNARLGTVPPLGKFLDPLGGFWQNNTTSDEIPEKLEIPGLTGRVTVVWDDRHVPHVFAGNEDDLYRTQGYPHGARPAVADGIPFALHRRAPGRDLR